MINATILPWMALAFLQIPLIHAQRRSVQPSGYEENSRWPADPSSYKNSHFDPKTHDQFYNGGQFSQDAEDTTTSTTAGPSAEITESTSTERKVVFNSERTTPRSSLESTDRHFGQKTTKTGFSNDFGEKQRHYFNRSRESTGSGKRATTWNNVNRFAHTQASPRTEESVEATTLSTDNLGLSIDRDDQRVTQNQKNQRQKNVDVYDEAMQQSIDYMIKNTPTPTPSPAANNPYANVTPRPRQKILRGRTRFQNSVDDGEKRAKSTENVWSRTPNKFVSQNPKPQEEGYATDWTVPPNAGGDRDTSRVRRPSSEEPRSRNRNRNNDEESFNRDPYSENHATSTTRGQFRQTAVTSEGSYQDNDDRTSTIHQNRDDAPRRVEDGRGNGAREASNVHIAHVEPSGYDTNLDQLPPRPATDESNDETSYDNLGHEVPVNAGGVDRQQHSRWEPAVRGRAQPANEYGTIPPNHTGYLRKTERTTMAPLVVGNRRVGHDERFPLPNNLFAVDGYGPVDSERKDLDNILKEELKRLRQKLLAIEKFTKFTLDSSDSTPATLPDAGGYDAFSTDVNATTVDSDTVDNSTLLMTTAEALETTVQTTAEPVDNETSPLPVATPSAVPESPAKDDVLKDTTDRLLHALNEDGKRRRVDGDTTTSPNATVIESSLDGRPLITVQKTVMLTMPNTQNSTGNWTIVGKDTTGSSNTTTPLIIQPTKSATAATPPQQGNSTADDEFLVKTANETLQQTSTDDNFSSTTEMTTIESSTPFATTLQPLDLIKTLVDFTSSNDTNGLNGTSTDFAPTISSKKFTEKPGEELRT